jgi:hypothetical protein
MIHRVIVISKMKDKAREEFEKYFKNYITYSIDKYSNEIKGIGFVFEVDGLGDDKIVQINKVAEGIAKATQVPVLVQRFESASKIIRPDDTVSVE